MIAPPQASRLNHFSYCIYMLLHMQALLARISILQETLSFMQHSVYAA